jgi:hypothetical protein
LKICKTASDNAIGDCNAIDEAGQVAEPDVAPEVTVLASLKIFETASDNPKDQELTELQMPETDLEMPDLTRAPIESVSKGLHVQGRDAIHVSE